MNKFKKVLTLSMCTMLLASSLAGCASKQDAGAAAPKEEAATAEKTDVKVNLEGYPIVEETVELKAVGFGEPGGGEWNDFPVFADLAEQTNVKVDFLTISGDGAEEKLNLILASNDLPDMFFSGLSTVKITKYADMGLFVPLEDLIENYAPNIKAILEERPSIRKAITMPDGHIYALPAIQTNEDPVKTTTLNINKTWLDKLGLEVPKTTEEFKVVLEAFKTKDPNGNGKPDEIPFTYEPVPPYNVWNGDTGLSGSFGVTDSSENLMIKDNKLLFTPIQDGYKDYIKWTNELYKAGLIDAEIFTQDHNQYMAKISSDYLGAYLTNGPVKTSNVEYVAIEPLAGPNGDRLWSSVDFSIDKNRAIISATNKHPEVSMRYLDSFFEKETSLKLRHGIYLTTKEDKWDILPSEPGKKSLAPGPYVPTIVTKETEDNEIVQTEDNIKSKEIEATYKPFLAPAIPLITFTPEESKEISTIQTDLQNFVNENKAKWTTGQGNIDAEWEAYVTTLNNMGLERYMEIYTAAYDRYMSN